MTDVYVPINELAKHLCVKTSTIRTWVHKNYIPKEAYLKIGYTYRFNVQAVLAALKADPSATTTETEVDVPVVDSTEGPEDMEALGSIMDIMDDDSEESTPEQLEMNFDEDDDL